MTRIAKVLALILPALLPTKAVPAQASGSLDYEQSIPLDAESLAEGGIKRAYTALLVRLRAYVPNPWTLEEHLDSDKPAYSVSAHGVTYQIYSQSLREPESMSWVRATDALFSIVNAQLASSPYKLYALNGGNELFGIFLTQVDVEAAKKSLPKRSDWPYLPNSRPPDFGQYR